MALDGFVISNIVYELNQTILNAKISKIAQPENDELDRKSTRLNSSHTS